MLTIAAVAYDPRVVSIWEGICDYLTGAEVPVTYVLYRSYEQQIEALFAKQVDVAWNTNLAYVRSQARAAGRCQALAMRDTDRDWTSQLIARPDAKEAIRVLGDLRGRSLALGSRDSGHAAILPVYFLAREGLRADIDYRPLRFDLDVGKHGDTGNSEEAVLHAVRDGVADAGVVGGPFWARALASGEARHGEVAAIWTSPPFDHCMFTALPDFDAGLGAAFTSALFSMSYDDPAHRPILHAEGLKQWLPPRPERDSGYASLGAALKESGPL